MLVDGRVKSLFFYVEQNLSQVFTCFGFRSELFSPLLFCSAGANYVVGSLEFKVTVIKPLKHPAVTHI